MVRRLFILFSIILAMSGCGRSRKTPVRIPQASDSLYTAQAALKIYGKEPERALAIIDSALVVGNVSEFKADFLRAKILAGSLEVVQRDAAIILCERLLLHDSTQVVDKTTSVNRNNVLDVMLGACRTNGDDDKWLRYAIERADLCRSMGMETESLRMEAEIGAAMTRMGRREEGMIKMEKAINALEKGDPSVDRMDAGIVARKRRIVVLDHACRYQDIIPDAQAIIRKLDDYQSRPSMYAEDISIENFLSNDAGQSLTVVGYDPENSSSGGATVTESFSMSLGGSMGCGTSGPSASASVGLSWGTSVAKFSPDLSAKANLTTNGEVSWSYTGSRPGTHWEFADIGEHDLAASKDLFDKNPDIMKEAATVGGLTSGYTIIWKNLNGTEDSNFTYEVKF